MMTIDNFDDFFRELHGHAPYPWQKDLAVAAVSKGWPGAIDLPTGSGKTACLDIALFALACQATSNVEERTTPRRIFFCVNRRVIVGEAYARSRKIMEALKQAERETNTTRPVLRGVAKALREIANTNTCEHIPPVDVLELRGGIYRDNRWARSATQPTIICTTLDQLGSRLLFRGYGVSAGAAPIQAALIAYDSLVFLDEAHISEPFRQTLDHVARYLDPSRWAEQPIAAKPMTVVSMTATPNTAMRDRGVIQLGDEDRRIPSLSKRLAATKPAELQEVSNVVHSAVETAVQWAREKPVAVGIIVNRVATAKRIYHALHEQRIAKKPKIPVDATIELVIGSMRPIDRDEQEKSLRNLVGPQRPRPNSTETSFIVATQCLEVGADYDFDALVTECASLDALRQRFGRLNRAGREIEARAVILAEKKSIKPNDKLDAAKPLDPIYGNASARVWNWLHAHATNNVVDFGIDALDALLRDRNPHGRPPEELLSPSASLSAPVMMPAYLDLWCQTSPRPAPDPDVSLFIHGPTTAEPDVQVCWRADLVENARMRPDEHWCDLVALLPPTSAECMRVPISRVRRWLVDQLDADQSGDALGADEQPEAKKQEQSHIRIKAVLWRGLKESRMLKSSADIRPGDTIVLPASATQSHRLGHLPELSSALEDLSPEVLSPTIIDHAENAFLRARNCVALRLHPALKDRLPHATTAIEELFTEAKTHCTERVRVARWRELLHAAAPDLAKLASDPAETRFALTELAKHGLRIEPYPDNQGVVLTSRARLDFNSATYLPPLDEGDDEASRTQCRASVLLADHTANVAAALTRSLDRLPLADFDTTLPKAAELHDLGKADERFQAMLRRSDRTDAWLFAGRSRAVLAKSDGVPQTREQRDEARARSGLPSGFRHEMLSVQLAELSSDLPDDEWARDLTLHLIAAHHGHARPFAPVVRDLEMPTVTVNGIVFSDSQRQGSIPSHRLDSGIAERFWRLTRRHGWWGLAYLEALLRLADQQASAAEDRGEDKPTETQKTPETVEAAP